MFDSLATQVLIQEIQAGDQEAYNQLCQRYMARVFSAVRLRLGNKLRAKLQSCDVVQDVMLDVLKGAENFECRSEGAFLHWVNRAVENRIRDKADHFKAQKRDQDRETPLEKTRSPGDSTPLDIPGDDRAQTPSMIAVRQEELELLEQTMDTLMDVSEEYHSLIIAVKIEGQTYGEIAEATGKSADAVRMQVNRAQIELAKIYRRIEQGV
jgi:RNA polymerase sigma factor (sigma-70 family)